MLSNNNNNKLSFWLWVTGQFPISLIIMCSVHDLIMTEGSSISKDHRHRVMVPSARNRRVWALWEKLHCQTESGETRLFSWMIHSRVQASFNWRAKQSTRSWAAPPATWASLFDGKASKRCFMSTQTCLQRGCLKEPYRGKKWLLPDLFVLPTRRRTSKCRKHGNWRGFWMERLLETGPLAFAWLPASQVKLIVAEISLQTFPSMGAQWSRPPILIFLHVKWPI